MREELSRPRAECMWSGSQNGTARRGRRWGAACRSCHIRLRTVRSTKSEELVRERCERLAINPIRQRRLELGLSQRQLAEKVGVGHRVVAKWEAGGHPDETMRPKLAELLGFDPLELVRRLPEQLRQYREAHDLSRGELAKMLNLDPGTIWRWETGKTTRLQWEYVERVQAFLRGVSTRHDSDRAET